MISGRGAVARAPACLLVSGWFSAARSLPLAVAELHVGAATIDITPDKPVALDGQRRVRISKTLATHIYAAALALESREGDRVLDQAIMMSCDLVAIRQGIRRTGTMQVNQSSAIETVHRLLFRALLEVRSQGHDEKNNAVFHLSDLFHAVVLEMENAAEGRCTYEDVLKVLEERAKEKSLDQWPRQNVTDLAESSPNQRMPLPRAAEAQVIRRSGCRRPSRESHRCRILYRLSSYVPAYRNSIGTAIRGLDAREMTRDGVPSYCWLWPNRVKIFVANQKLKSSGDLPMTKTFLRVAARSMVTGLILIVGAIAPAFAANSEPRDGELQPLLGEPKLEMRRLFEGERFPNVVVATDGTVLATWGSKWVRVRRSEDGGTTWGPEIAIGDGIHGGGAIVDQISGDVLVFTHPEHPPRDGQTAPRTVCRSADHGKTWQKAEATFQKDARGFVPSLHMMEHGTTLRRGPHKGRLIRPARVYRTSPERYATTIFSDDGGRNWRAGQPFAELGTGEAALVELSDGRLLGTARKSFFGEDEPLRHERVFAYSDDGGVTWRDAFHAKAIPDGPRYRGTERRGANYNGHFGMFNGLTRLPVQGRDILIYSNADHDGHERIRMTVWASFDGGKTWPVKRLVNEGPSAYSSLTAGRPGTASEGWIYLQFEYGEGMQQYAGCQLARFNLTWLLAGEATGDGRLPEWVSAVNKAGG